MTPEAGDYLNKARQSLQEARAVAAIELALAAGRAAYLAAYHAARAFIFDRTGKIAKTHSGARSEFARLAKMILALSGLLRRSSRRRTL